MTQPAEANPPSFPVPAVDRHTRFLARVLGAGAFALLGAIAWGLRPEGPPLAASLVAAGLVGWAMERLVSRRVRRRAKLRAAPFPPGWEEILLQEVVFYRVLKPEERLRFQKDVQVFLGEKLVTGIGTEVDDRVRVLTAASAVIPIFGFPDWEWDQINEVLIYPNRFNQEYDFAAEAGHHTLGMVGTGAMNRMMILTKPDLFAGFGNPQDKRNVGLHEFAHLVDKSDGVIDGVPEVGLDHRSVGPWIELVRRKMLEMEEGRSDIDPYGLTNEAEFFAVATEYFFERPDQMQERHPDLYAMLAQVFRQDLATRAKALLETARLRGKKFGRNSPCPCGSGTKFKKCCRLKAERFQRRWRRG